MPQRKLELSYLSFIVGFEDKQNFLTRINQVDMYNIFLCFMTYLHWPNRSTHLRSDITFILALLPFVLRS